MVNKCSVNEFRASVFLFKSLLIMFDDDISRDVVTEVCILSEVIRVESEKKNKNIEKEKRIARRNFFFRKMLLLIGL